MDGESEMSEQSVAYTFKSEFADEDILYTFAEILSDDIENKLVYRVRLYGPRSAEHLCTIVIKLPPDKNLEWPEMSKDQKEVIKELMIEQKDQHSNTPKTMFKLIAFRLPNVNAVDGKQALEVI